MLTLFFIFFLFFLSKLHPQRGAWTQNPEIRVAWLYRLSQLGTPKFCFVLFCFSLTYLYAQCGARTHNPNTESHTPPTEPASRPWTNENLCGTQRQPYIQRDSLRFSALPIKVSVLWWLPPRGSHKHCLQHSLPLIPLSSRSISPVFIFFFFCSLSVYLMGLSHHLLITSLLTICPRIICGPVSPNRWKTPWCWDSFWNLL